MATNLTLGTIFTADVQNFLKGIGQIKSALNTLHQSFTQAGSGASAMGKGMANALNTTTAALNKQTQAIKQSQQQLTGLAGMWQRVQQAMKTSLAYGTAGAAIYTIIDGLKKGITTIADYDQALKNLQAITQATDAEMVGLADTIKDVSAKYVFSTKEISDGMVLMGQAGFTATQTMQAMDAAAKLAMGTLEDMELTVDLLTTTVVSFNMKSVESEKIADIMANAMNRSKLTLDKLRVSFNYVGNAAYEAGISLEETAAAMAVMSNAGMRASTIGTAFRQVIANLIAPNRRVREEIQGLGIELSQLDPKVAGFSAVVQNLNKILVDQKTGLVDMTKAYNLFGLRAAQAAAILARTATDEYPRMLSMMYEVGSASAMADKQMGGLVARFKNLAVNAQLIAVAIGEGGVITVLNGLADALLFVVKAINMFVSSDVGKVTTSFIAWSAAAAAAILVYKGFVSLLLGSVVPAIIRFGSELKIAVGLMMAANVGSLVDKFNLLLSVLTRGNPVFLAYAVAIGAIVAAVTYWSKAEDRQIETLTRSSNAYRTAADTFGAYRDKLVELKKEMAKGKDVSVEYNATILRLHKAYSPLKGVIENTTDAIDKNIKKLDEYEKASIEKDIQKQIDLLKIYEKQMDVATGKVQEFGMESIDSLQASVPGLVAVGQESMQLEEDLKKLGGAFEDVGASSENIVDSFDKVVSAENQTGKEAQKTSEILKNQDAAFVAAAKGWERLGNSIDEIKTKLRELGATEGQIKTVEQALKKWSDDVAKEASEIEAAMQNMPHVFKEFFDTLDAGAKVAFAKTIKSMEAEVSQHQKTAQAILKTEEDRYAAEAFIRAQAANKFADDFMKEKMTSEQLLNFKRKLNEELKRLANQRFDEIADDYKRIYASEVEAAKGKTEKIEAAEKKLNDRLINLRQRRKETMVGLEQGEGSAIVIAFKKTADEVVKTGQKMADDYLNQLQRLVDQSEEKVKQLGKARLSNEEGLTDKIRNLKQRGMSDSEKFADDGARVNGLLGKARDATYKKSFDEAKKYYDKASDVAENLATEIKDSQGNTIRSEAETAATAIRYLETIKQESGRLYEQEIEQEKKRSEEAKTLINQLTDLLKNFGGEWDKISQQKMGNFINSLNEVLDRMKGIQGITSNIKKDWETVTGKYAKQPKPAEPSIGAKQGLEAVQKAPEGEGIITVGGKSYSVHDLAGGGGTISVDGKTYGVNEYAGGNTISVGGKTFDINEFADGVQKGVTSGFDEWYAKSATKYNLNPDPYAKEHYYDYEAAYKSGVRSPDESGHWPSEFKMEGHPNMVVDGINTKTGEIVDKVEELSGNLVEVEGTAQNIETSFANTSGSISGTVAQMEQLSTAAEWIKTQFADVTTALTTLSQTPLKELITQGALHILTNVKSTLADIKSDWDSIESKTVTLTIETKGGTGSSESGGSESSGGGGGSVSYDNPDGGGYDETAYHRWGGLVQGVKDFASHVYTFARKGLKLPGYGGGDRVPVMAEPGEFIVNKEATSKFLPFIEAINNDTVANMGKRFGGVIKSAVRNLHFQQGGSVPAMAMAGSGGITVGKIEIKPMYMSGDRAAARKLAIDIERELSELQKRKGK